jgi:predicted nucleic acid-binding protein
MSVDRTFVDTNIIVYAYDRSAGSKHELAREVLIDLWKSGLGVVSTQVIQEFFVTVTRKLPKPMESPIAREVVKDLLKWNHVTIDGPMILSAIDLHKDHRYSFWDSLIVTAALHAECTLLLSEDLASGHTVAGVVIKNPFV